MSNKEFEKVVLEKLNILTTDMGDVKSDISGLKEDFSGLKEDVSGLKEDVFGLKGEVGVLNRKIDKLDDKVDDQTHELKQTIRQQGSYIDQAFNRIFRMLNILGNIVYNKKKLGQTTLFK